MAEPVSTVWHQSRPVEADDQAVLLVLEPEQELAELISKGLALYGYRLRSVSNGQEWPDSMDDVDLVMVRDTLLEDESAHWLPRLHDRPVICFSQAHEFTTVTGWPAWALMPVLMSPRIFQLLLTG